MQDRHGGLYSLDGSTLPFPTDPALRILSLMCFLVSSVLLRTALPQKLFCPVIVWLGLWSGESNGR